MERPQELITYRGNQTICLADVNSYESLRARWKWQKNLHGWWKARGVEIVLAETGTRKREISNKGQSRVDQG